MLRAVLHFILLFATFFVQAETFQVISYHDVVSIEEKLAAPDDINVRRLADHFDRVREPDEEPAVGERRNGSVLVESALFELEQGKVTRALAVVFEAFGHFGYALQPVAGGRDG